MSHMITKADAQQKSTSRYRSISRKGFTLIELLIVIAIIAILAAILFPVFARARENARKTSCLSNLKQIGLGVMQYTQDYDEYYPLNQAGSTQTERRQNSWRSQIFPYVKSTQLFVCPSNPLKDTWTNDSTQGGGGVIDPTEFKISYQCNRRGALGRGTATPVEMSHVAEIENAAQLITIAEVRGTSAAYDGDLNYDDAGHNNALFAGHLGMTNYLFADGHAKALRPSSTIASGTRLMWDKRPTQAAQAPSTNMRNMLQSAENSAN